MPNPSYGTLLTRVYTSRGQLPIENASVSIIQHNKDGEGSLINVQASDESGNTQPTTLETPSLQNSLSSDQGSPFSVYDIWAEHPGYQLLLVQNVQIFPGITSIQDLPMIPLAETLGKPADRVDITPQNL